MPSSVRSEKLNVLVIDDEEEIRLGVTCRLNAAGYRTSQAEDGKTGIAKAKEESPDVILMDVRMPGISGIAALHELRSNSTTTHIPVVMLSASLRDEQRALDAGASFYVHKPYDSKRLLAAVKSAVKHHENLRFDLRHELHR